MDIAIAFVILVVDFWALYEVLGSAVTATSKVLWTLLVVALPGIGFVVWLVSGPKRTRKRRVAP